MSTYLSALAVHCNNTQHGSQHKAEVHPGAAVEAYFLTTPGLALPTDALSPHHAPYLDQLGKMFDFPKAYIFPEEPPNFIFDQEADDYRAHYLHASARLTIFLDAITTLGATMAESHYTGQMRTRRSRDFQDYEFYDAIAVQVNQRHEGEADWQRCPATAELVSYLLYLFVTGRREAGRDADAREGLAPAVGKWFEAWERFIGDV